MIKKLKGKYPPYVLSDKINEIIENQNRIERAVEYLAKEVYVNPLTEVDTVLVVRNILEGIVKPGSDEGHIC